MTSKTNVKRVLKKAGVDPATVQVKRTGAGHLALTLAGTSGPIYVATTPSDWRAERNQVARVRRAAAKVGGVVNV